ncbi:MAG: site-2 protease family protein [Cyanobacteria bacterium J06614_10]
MVTVLLLLAASAILAWGYTKAKPFGKLGILAWLQTVVLMVPWLLFFGFSAAGIYLNLAGILILVISSAGLYIYLGRQLRAADREALAAQRAQTLVEENGQGTTPTAETMATPVDAQAAAGMSSSETRSGEAGKTMVASSQRLEATATAADSKKTVEQASAKDEDNKPPIPPEDLALIEGIFGVDTFFRTKTVPYQEGAIFKGNLRGKPGETADILSQKLAGICGDRYHAFLLANPENKPVVVVLPKANGPSETTVAQKVLAVVLAVATLATSLETAAILQGFDIFQSPERWPEVVPIGLGIVAILAAHEVGHWVLARRRDVNISPPFFLPAWQLGSFGSLMRFESILPNRSVLFDVSFAGPAAGGLLSFIFLFVGLVLSHPGSLFQLPSEFFQGSVFVGTLARAVLGDALQADLVDIHPLMIVGWLGLIINAINLMPAGQLDGGRIVQAIYGRRTLIRASAVTLVLLAIVGLFNPLSLYWAVLIVFLQRQPERPCTDDLSEPDDARAALALLSLFLMLLVLLPLTPSLAVRLGIG